MKLIKLGYYYSVLVFLTACGAPAPIDTSSLEGHYENSTEAKMQVYQGAQFAVPEYAPVSKVIVSLPLISSFNREDLIVEIFKAGADQVLISYDLYDRNLDLSSRVFNKLRDQLENLDTLDSDGQLVRRSRLADIKLIPHDTNSMSRDDRTTVWARDWAPLGGAVTVASEGALIGSLRLIDFNYYPNRQIDDYSSQAYAKEKSLERVSVPVYNEGGNFMNNDKGHCMMTTRVVEANAGKFRADDLILNASQISEYYRNFAGCTDVTIFPRMPYEGTGHIDMFAKFLDNETVLVSQLDTLTIDTMPAIQRDLAIDVSVFLEATAKDIEAMGYRVVRVPMPSPNFYADGSSVFRSYSNSLLVNGVAIVPRYTRGFGVSYSDSSRIADYEAETLRVYNQAGYQVVWIDSDSLIASGGAVHCVTMQVPKL